MRKLFTFLAALCCTMFTAVMAEDLADGVLISVGEETMHAGNKDDFRPTGLIEGQISYNDEEHILMLENAVLNKALQIEANNLSAFTIELVGWNQINVDEDGASGALMFRMGDELILTGESLEINVTGEADVAALLCSNTFVTGFHKLTVTGGAVLELKGNGKRPEIICSEVMFGRCSAYIGSKSHDNDAIKGDIKHGTGEELSTHITYYPDKANYLRVEPCTELYPVWVNGYQLNDGISWMDGDDMQCIFTGYINYDSGSRILDLVDLYLVADNNDAKAAIVINDDQSSEPITIVCYNSSCAINTSDEVDMSNVFGLWAVTDAIIDLNGENMNIGSDKAVALNFMGNLTIENNTAEDVRLSVEAANGYGLFCSSMSTKTLTISNCEVHADGKEMSFGGFALVLDGVDLDNVDKHEWSDDVLAVVAKGTTDPVEDEVVYKRVEWRLYGYAEPWNAGHVQLPEDVDYYVYNEDQDVDIKAIVDEKDAYAFGKWENSSRNAERTISLSAGSGMEVIAYFSRTVKTNEKYFMVNGNALYSFGDKFRGELTKVADLPGIGEGEHVSRALYVDGAIWFVKLNESDQAGLYKVAFDGETLGESAEEVKAMQAKYPKMYAIDYNESDECFYAIAYDSEDYGNHLIKITKAGEITEIGTVTYHDPQFMAFNPSSSELMFVYEGEIYTLDLSDASEHYVGGTSLFASGSSWESCAGVFDKSTEELIYFRRYSGYTSDIKLAVADGDYLDSEWIEEFYGDYNCRGLFSVAPAGVSYEITVESSDETKGLVSIDGGSQGATFTKKVKENTTMTITALPKKGYLFSAWSDKGEKSHEITVTADATYTATFVEDPDQKVYPISVAGTVLESSVTTLVAGDPAALKSGVITFDPQTNTLTLNAIELASATDVPLQLGNEDADGELTIIVKGDCKIAASSTIASAIAITGYDAVKIIGDGENPKLTLTSDQRGISLDNSDLTIEGLEMSISGKEFGIIGTESESLSVLGANLQVQGKNEASITGLSNLESLYCSMDGFEFAEGGFVVKKDQETATKEIVKFVPWKSITVKPVEKETGHFTLVGDKNEIPFTDKGYFEEGEKVTITAVPAKGFSFGRWIDDTKWKNEEEAMGEEHEEITMGTKDLEYQALFYCDVKSGATWYGINKDNKMVQFSFGDRAYEVAKAKKPSSATFKGGDYGDEGWLYVEGSNLKLLPISGSFEDDEDLTQEGEVEITTKATNAPTGMTDMAFDLMAGETYAIAGSDLYKVDTEEDKFKKAGTLKYTNADEVTTTISAVAMAIDANSIIYVLAPGAEGVLYSFAASDIPDPEDEGDKDIPVELVGDEENNGKIGVKVTSDVQSIGFDHATGELFWGAADYMRIINLEGPSAYICADLGQTGGDQGYVKSLHRMDKTVKVTVKVAEGQESYGAATVGNKSSKRFIAGSQVTINAKANAGYHFAYWTREGKEDQYTSANYTFKAVKSTWIAHFAEGQGLDEVVFDSTKANKVLIDGTIYIVRDNAIYTITGLKVK